MHKLYQTTNEQATPLEGVVTGDIPSWVSGSLYRNGPGMYEIGEHQYKYIFDTLAMVQRFHICDKKVTYQRRFLQSDTYKTNTAANRIATPGLGTPMVPDPCMNMFPRFLTYFTAANISSEIDNSVVNIIPIHDNIYATSETQFIHRLHPGTLETEEKIDMEKYAVVNMASAHPHIDTDGSMHNFGYLYKGRPKLCFIKFPSKTENDKGFPHAELVHSQFTSVFFSNNYMHSFAITEHYYIYVEQPLIVNLITVLTAYVRGKTLIDAFEWSRDLKCRFHIIRKSNGDEVNPEIKYKADNFMVFHHINAYEDNEQIVIDLVAHKDNPLPRLFLKDLTSSEYQQTCKGIGDPEPRRYVLPLNVSTTTPIAENLVNLPYTSCTATITEELVVSCTGELLADIGFEFPQVSYQMYNGKKYRYTYGIGWRKQHLMFQSVLKIDTETKTCSEWKEDNCFPSEPVFIPDPNGTQEDDGVLLVAVNRSDFDAKQGKFAFLLVLDAQTMTELARAEFNLERFPRDLHGLFQKSS